MANIPGFTRIFDYSKWLEQQDLVPFLLGFQFLAGWNDSNLARILFFQINSFFLQKNSTSVEVVLPPKQASRKKQKRQEVRRFLNGNNFGQSFGDDLLGGQLCVLKECMNVKLPNGNPTSKDAEKLISKQIHRYIDEWMFYCFLVIGEITHPKVRLRDQTQTHFDFSTFDFLKLLNQQNICSKKCLLEPFLSKTHPPLFWKSRKKQHSVSWTFEQKRPSSWRMFFFFVCKRLGSFVCSDPDPLNKCGSRRFKKRTPEATDLI